MALDELSVVLKARQLVNEVSPTIFPVDVNPFLKQANAVVKEQGDLAENEPGWSFQSNGKHYICINKFDNAERKRFTVFHELAHIILGLPSDHSSPTWSYAKKSINEIWCDIFAAELLLPYNLFKPFVDRSDYSLDAIGKLAMQFEASFTATGSRYAAVAAGPCAFILAEKGIVRYPSRSPVLRGARIWIPPKMELPMGSVSARVRNGKAIDGAEEIDPELWIANWNRDGVMLEEARHFPKRDQTLALLWLEEDELPEPGLRDRRTHEEEEQGLAELDGILPWPGKRRRR